jgi:hypothetical protein
VKDPRLARKTECFSSKHRRETNTMRKAKNCYLRICCSSSPLGLSLSIYSLLELFSRTNFCFNFPTDFIAKLTPLTYLNQPVRRSPHFLRYLLLNDALLSAQSSGTVYPSHAPDLLSFMAFSLPCIGHPHIHNSPPSHADIRHAYQCITLLAWAPLPTPY